MISRFDEYIKEYFNDSYIMNDKDRTPYECEVIDNQDYFKIKLIPLYKNEKDRFIAVGLYGAEGFSFDEKRYISIFCGNFKFMLKKEYNCFVFESLKKSNFIFYCIKTSDNYILLEYNKGRKIKNTYKCNSLYTCFRRIEKTIKENKNRKTMFGKNFSFL